MVYTDGRAPRDRVVTGPWPARIKPFENESLSSWLVRASFANFATPSQLTNYLWPYWRAWTRDVDRELEARQLSDLTLASGLSNTVISNLTLKPLITPIFNSKTLSQTTPWKWVIQRGTRNRNTHRSTQFCPSCLQTDRIPYLRLNWRLSFITVCTVHRVELLDCCPHCQASIEIHKLERGALKFCAHCRWDISDVVPARCEDELLNMTQRLVDQLDDIPNLDFVVFERLNYLLCLSRRLHSYASAIRGHVLVSLIRRIDEVRYRDTAKLSFDWLNIDDRRYFLSNITELMSLNDEELAHILMRSGIHPSLLQSIAFDSRLQQLMQFPERSSEPFNKASDHTEPVVKPLSKRLVQWRWHKFLKQHGLN